MDLNNTINPLLYYKDKFFDKLRKDLNHLNRTNECVFLEQYSIKLIIKRNLLSSLISTIFISITHHPNWIHQFFVLNCLKSCGYLYLFYKNYLFYQNIEIVITSRFQYFAILKQTREILYYTRLNIHKSLIRWTSKLYIDPKDNTIHFF